MCWLTRPLCLQPGLPFLALCFKAKFSVSFLFPSYPCPIAKPVSFPPFHLPDSTS